MELRYCRGDVPATALGLGELWQEDWMVRSEEPLIRLGRQRPLKSPFAVALHACQCQLANSWR